MKLKTILSAVGAAVAVAGLTPYKVSKDQETGEVKATALLWNGSYVPATEDAARNVTVNVGLNIPGKAKGEDDEAHLYTDDVTISYADTPAAEAAEAAASETAPAEEAAPAEESAEEAAPAEEEAAPAEEAPAEESAEEAPAEESVPEN